MIPGASVSRLLALPLGHPPDHVEHVGVVVVGAEDHLQHDRGGGDHQRRQRAPSRSESTSIECGSICEASSRISGVEDQHGDEAEHERERQSQRGDQRRQHGVQRRRSAPPRRTRRGAVWTVTCGTIAAATNTATADTSQCSAKEQRPEPWRLRAPARPPRRTLAPALHPRGEYRVCRRHASSGSGDDAIGRGVQDLGDRPATAPTGVGHVARARDGAARDRRRPRAHRSGPARRVGPLVRIAAPVDARGGGSTWCALAPARRPRRSADAAPAGALRSSARAPAGGGVVAAGRVDAMFMSWERARRSRSAG